jgi:hypothetical protein
MTDLLAMTLKLIFCLLIFSQSSLAESQIELQSPGRNNKQESKLEGSEIIPELSPEHPNSDEKSILGKFEDLQNNYEKERLEQQFSNVDILFNKTKIMFQKILLDDQLGPEQHANLYYFLSGPHGIDQIMPIIEEEIHDQQILKVLREKNFGENASFGNVVRYLWDHHLISDIKAHTILVRHSPISPREIINLIENGVVKSASGYLVKIRTGHQYGDPLTLFSKIDGVLRKFSEHRQLEELETPLKEEMAAEFNRNGIDGNEAIIDGQIIQRLRNYFLFISSIGMPIRFRPFTSGFNPGSPGGASVVNPLNSFTATISPRTISAMLVGNYYFADSNASLNSVFFVNPLGLSYSGSMSFTNFGLDAWVFYTNNYLGGGLGYTQNFADGTLWSKGQPSYVSVGVMAAGWRDYFTAGFSLQTVLANSVGVGASASVTVSHTHTVNYLGLYPIDGKFASLRGLHKIEIHDNSMIGGLAGVSVNFSAAKVPVSVAFRTGAEYRLNSVYRTHTELSQAQEMLKEHDFPGLLIMAGKKISASRIPSFERPADLMEGDELVEKKIGQLSGAFVIGLESMVPIAAARVGGTAEITAEFELGIKKLPNNKYEVSIEPTRIFEMGIFGSVLNVLGAGFIHGISIARKQIFSFDFNQKEARRAYDELLEEGLLPTSQEIEISANDRGPEYLLSEFREQNIPMRKRGIERIYLEKIRIGVSKGHVGFGTPLIPGVLAMINKVDKETRKNKVRLDLHFEDIDREFVVSEANSVATNGIIAVRRSTFGGRISEGQGFSGRYNRDIFVTHRRVHTLKELSLGHIENSWFFHGLVVNAQFEDTKTTGNEENRMVEKINRLFGTTIGSFEHRNSKSPRVINIEREITQGDLMSLTLPEARERIYAAVRATGIASHVIANLLDELINKHPDHQGMKVKEFIQNADGFTGFAAIHHLLGGRQEDIIIHTESGYMKTVQDAKTFIINHTDPKSSYDFPKAKLSSLDTRANKKYIRKFYNGARFHLREIDRQLRLLHDDKYLLDKDSSLSNALDSDDAKEMLESGARQDKSGFKSALVTVRKTLLDLLDLEMQGFSKHERMEIFTLAKKKRLRFEEVAEIILNSYSDKTIKASMKKSDIISRYGECRDMIEKIDDRIKGMKEDSVLIRMDPDYVEVYLDSLQSLRKQFKKASSLKRLKPEDAQAILEKFKPSNNVFLNLFRRKRHDEYRIEGALEALADSKTKNRNSSRQSVVHTPHEYKLSQRRQKTHSISHLKTPLRQKDDILQSSSSDSSLISQEHETLISSKEIEIEEHL